MTPKTQAGAESPGESRSSECEYRGEHGRIDERLGQLEGREEKQDAKLDALERTAGGIREELAGMRGELRGAIAASKVSGAIVGGVVSFAASAALGLLMLLLGKR